VTRAIADTDPDGFPAGLDRLRVLASAAMGTVLVSYAMLVPTAAIVVHSGGRGRSFDGTFAAAVPLWLAAHQVPLTIQGQPMSVLPLMPTAAVILVVLAGSTWAVRRLGSRAATDGGAVLATVGGAHAAVAVLGSALLPPEVEADPWTAMLAAGLVAASGVGLAVARACGVQVFEQRWRPMPVWVSPGLRGALVGIAALLTVGAAVLFVGLVAAAGDVRAAFERLVPSGSAGLAVTMLSFAYLPNAVVAAASWGLGSGIGVGLAWASPFTAVAGAEVSSFPLLAALPAQAPGWAPVFLVLPVLAGVLVGRACTRFCGAAAVPARVLAALVAVATTALAAALLALLAGGRLAAGTYDPVRVPAGFVLLAVLLWVGVPAVAGAALPPAARPDERLTALRARRAALRAATVTSPKAVTVGPVVPQPRHPMTVADLVARREAAQHPEQPAGPAQEAGDTAPEGPDTAT
jgi:hypothetical protein